MRTLIVYFSRTGYTKRIAESIAKEMHATLLPITETRSRLGFIGYQRCVLEAAFGFNAKIDKAAIDPKSFDLVLLGTPIWGWHLASPVRAFARQHAQAIGSCGFFCTMGGSGASAAFTELQEIIGHAPLATLALTDREVDSGAAAAKVEHLAAVLREPDAKPR